jgi:transposase InsO family protein
VSESTRFSAEAKAELLRLVTRTHERTGWTVQRILTLLGLSKARYRAWRKRAAASALTDRRPIAPACDAVLPEEKAAVLAYALAHPKDGYRRLTWQMIDADIAYLSESSVYRILRDAELLARWKRSTHSGQAPTKPTRPHERWHTDLMYLRIADSWYFLVTVLDAYSRYVVHWELLTSMMASDVRLVIQQALEMTGATPRLVTDNGSQFTAAEFKELVRRFALEHIRIRTYHPESNGLVERFHRSTREALSDQAIANLSQARTIIAAWIREYNDERLHAGLGYLTPATYYRGDPAAQRAARQQKLEQAQRTRRRINEERLKAAA